MDLSCWIDRHADFSPEKTAIHFQGCDISYAALAEHIAHLSAVLTVKLDVGRGDRVAFLGQNSPEAVALLFACARIGAIFAPLNWRLAPPEHQRMLNDCTPQALFVEPEFTEQVDGIRADLSVAHYISMGAASEFWQGFGEVLASTSVRTSAGNASYEDAVLICYTSGATGVPKGVVLSQNAILFNAINSAHCHDLTSADKVLTTIPLFHVGGLNIQSTPALHLGATVILQRSFDPAATFDDFVRHGVTLTVLVPAQLQAMISHANWAEADLSGLRAVTTGSTFVPDRFVQAFHARGVPVLQVYGATETAPITVYTNRQDAVARVGAAGKPALHCEIRIVDEDGRDITDGRSGEILIRGPNVMLEYWHQPETTAKAVRDGWYHSGDMGHVDAEGFCYVDDRKKDMIISGGENIYPAELENILADCEYVAEAAVVGRDDKTWGEVAVAVVVSRAENTLVADDVLKLFEGALARYKHPKDVVFTDSLPRNAMGKVLKDELRAMVGQLGIGQRVGN